MCPRLWSWNQPEFTHEWFRLVLPLGLESRMCSSGARSYRPRCRCDGPLRGVVKRPSEVRGEYVVKFFRIGLL